MSSYTAELDLHQFSKGVNTTLPLLLAHAFEKEA